MRPFESPGTSLGELDADSAAALIAVCSDVALIVDEHGIIRDLSFGSDEFSKDGHLDWVGKPWVQTVTVESRGKVEALLRDAGASLAPRWRHINHPTSTGVDLPLMYSAIPVGTTRRTLAVGRAVAFGRDMRANAALQQRLISAQQAMERDYWRLRHLETRYRSLFQVATEAVLILDAGTLKVEEANPAAAALLGAQTRRGGWHIAETFAPADVAGVQDLFAAVRATGRGDSVRATLLSDETEYDVAVSLFRQEKSSHFLVRLAARHGQTPVASARERMMLALLENAPDGFAVTDLEGRILTANRAFLDLAQLANEAQARGATLDRWLGRPGVDLPVLLNNLKQHGSVKLFATSMRDEYGTPTEVEISAVAVPDTDPPCHGFTIRDVGRRLPADPKAMRELPRSPGQMTELVGRVPLKDIVRQTTDLIEQLCIEAALELTGDNRASAAEMLGLSRQSLYVKLRRFNLGDLGGNDDE